MRTPTKLSIKPGKKKSKVNSNFLIDLTTIAMVDEDQRPAKGEPSNVNEAWNDSDEESETQWHETIRKNLET